jgi:hypothetical protein
MSVKSICACALVLMLVGVAGAQDKYAPAPGAIKDPAETVLETNGAPPVASVGAPGRLSQYLTYVTPDCCGPLGGRVIGSELYFRLGASAPIEGGFFQQTLRTGWDLGGGGRMLLFNQPADAAWVLDLGFSNISNHGQRPDLSTPISTFAPGGLFGQPTRITVPVTVSDLNRTFFNFSLGREWYLNGSAHDREGRHWRAGGDVGGRWGTARLDLHEIPHRTDVITGTFLSVHTDLEVPWGACVLIAGFRFEWDYTWMDILQETANANLQDVNFLFNLGIRF